MYFATLGRPDVGDLIAPAVYLWFPCLFNGLRAGDRIADVRKASANRKRRHVFKQTATNINRVRKKSAKQIHTVLLRTLRCETCELQIFIAVTVWRCDRSQESSSLCLDHFSLEKFIQRRKDHTRQQLYVKDAKIEENISSLLRELPSEHPLSTVSKRCAPPRAKEKF